MGGMKKTTVYLPSELKERLEQLAKRERRSEADVIREAIAGYADRAKPPRLTLPLFPKGTLDPTIAERVDELLAEGFGED